MVMPETKNRKDTVITAAVTILAVLLIAYNIFSYYGAHLSLPGKEIKKIQGLDPLSNETISIDINSGIVIVNFWATWCGACVQEIPELIKISEKYKMVGVIKRPFRKEDLISRDLNFQNILPDDSFFDKQSISVLPTTLLMQNGIVKKVQTGTISIETVEGWVRSLNE